MSTPDPKSSRKQKQKEFKSHPAPNGTERLKIVVRRLPPNLPEDIFWQSVQPWVTDDTVSWKTYCPGKLRTKRLNKEGIPSRAYVVFKSEDQVALFSRAYDGHVFRDKAGNESFALVEFAPFQKVPTEKKKVDARNNTIDKDDDYISFCETLKNAARTESVSLEALIAASQPPPAPTTTPLLEALKAEKSAQKDKEAILRNHTHYKDITAGALSKKEDAKKKAVAVQAAKQPSEPPAALSRKAKKAAAAAAAAQKVSSIQPQDGQGKSPPAMKPVTIVAHPSRSRPPKDRLHLGKVDASAPVTAPVLGASLGSAPTKSDASIPLPATTENAPGSPVPAPRGKGRPVVGLGRQFEAALNGAGVAVAPGTGGDRKKRDKGGGESTTEGAGRAGKHREEHKAAAPVVPSILQRPDAGGVTEPMIIVPRPQSPRVEVGSAIQGGHGEGTPRGGRRGRGRGRGGHRGG